MRFDDYDYTEIATKYDLSLSKSLHVYYDIHFFKKVHLSSIKSDEIFHLIRVLLRVNTVADA